MSLSLSSSAFVEVNTPGLLSLRKREEVVRLGLDGDLVWLMPGSCCCCWQLSPSRTTFGQWFRAWGGREKCVIEFNKNWSYSIVLWIQIRSDPELSGQIGYGFGITVSDPNPDLNFLSFRKKIC
jgi:hypothetical protein